MPQPIYHFTNYWEGFAETFRFTPGQATSLLYRKTADEYELVGAMYTAPRNTSATSIAPHPVATSRAPSSAQVPQCVGARWRTSAARKNGAGNVYSRQGPFSLSSSDGWFTSTRLRRR